MVRKVYSTLFFNLYLFDAMKNHLLLVRLSDVLSLLNNLPALKPTAADKLRSSLSLQRLKSPDRRVAWVEPFTAEKETKIPHEAVSPYKQETQDDFFDRRASNAEDRMEYIGAASSSFPGDYM